MASQPQLSFDRPEDQTLVSRMSGNWRVAVKDDDNNPLRPGVNYKLHLPAQVPAKSCWSVIIYDAETYTMIANPMKKQAISSLNKDLKYNDDGSIDVYFGPDASERQCIEVSICFPT